MTINPSHLFYVEVFKKIDPIYFIGKDGLVSNIMLATDDPSKVPVPMLQKTVSYSKKLLVIILESWYGTHLCIRTLKKS